MTLSKVTKWLSQGWMDMSSSNNAEFLKWKWMLWLLYEQQAVGEKKAKGFLLDFKVVKKPYTLMGISHP